MNWLAVGLGAAIGAWLRWGLGLWLNAGHPALPFGTLAANLGGGFLAGFAFAFFSASSALPPEWRLFVITGLLGGLTTFSTFSTEAMTLLERGDFPWALAHAAFHLAGSIALCIAGAAACRHLFH
ncbi:MAG TPA: fluoride efflux transporter CrcB [Noviherbaspirillum sp.]|jgi:CrcB protein|uniref:fluoride efflux transporter CrcB n=1 Tax=Noviherbaspirillum sp. TaxID=1926288 RepID=UPI002F948A84